MRSAMSCADHATVGMGNEPSTRDWLTDRLEGAPCSAPRTRSRGVIWADRLRGPIVLPERGPIDLPAQERLRVEVAGPGQRRSFQLTDRHAILVQDAQLEFVDDRAFRRVRLVDGQAKIATGGGAPPKAVAAAVAGGDSAHFSEAVAVIGEMRRENGSVRLSPFDQRPERRSDMAEVDCDALAGKQLDRGMAERPNAPIFGHRCCVGGVVKVDLDNLEASLRLRVVAGKAHESGGNGWERKDVLSAFAVVSSTKIGPSLAVQRGLES